MKNYNKNREEDVLRLAERVLGDIDHFNISLEPRHYKNVDLVIENRRFGRLLVEIKSFRNIRIKEILDSISRVILENESCYASEQFLIMIYSQRLSKSLPGRIREFLDKINRSRVNWIHFDEVGEFSGDFFGEQLSGRINIDRNEKTFQAFYNREFENDLNMKKRSSSLSLTPNTAWLLKCLLLNGLNKKKYWGAPFCSELHDYKTLSKVSGISQTTCFNFIKDLTSRKYLMPKNRGYIIYNPIELVDLLKRYWLTEKKREMYFEPNGPMENYDEWFNKLWDRYCKVRKKYNQQVLIGGHFGAAALGVSWTNHQSVVFHLGGDNMISATSFVRGLRLQPSKDNQKTQIKFVFHKGQSPVMGRYDFELGDEGIVDLLQVAMDSVDSGGRGEEQYEYIKDKILKPHFERLEWSLL